MEFILASTNEHKVEELNSLLNEKGLSVKAAPKKLEVVEDGVSFQENAFKKASAYYEELGMPTLSDDSGLVIPERKDILGVHSARYAVELADYKDKNQALLKDILDLKGEHRQAYFICYLCFYINPCEVYFFEGRVYGRMAENIKGQNGFGYDPIFLPDGLGGKSLAEDKDWKMSHSHRAKACVEARKFFQGYIH